MTMIGSIKKMEFFQGFSDDQLARIAILCRGESHKEGATVFREGDQARQLYLLSSGQMLLEMEVPSTTGRPGIPTAVEVVTPGECFGWSAVVEPRRYTLTARCRTPCLVQAIDGELLQRILVEDPVLGYTFMAQLARMMGQRLRQTRARLTSGVGLLVTPQDVAASGV
jgi:CRP-like cAMP-binding protein